MFALILAAGCGSRMRPLTDSIPKALIEVAGQTIIGRIMESLAAVGIRQVAVVTGYRGEQVRAFLEQTHPAFEYRFIHNERFHETNNIHSMALAFEQLEIDDDVLLIESDLVAETAVFARVVQSPHPNVALVDRWRTGLDGTVVTVADGDITRVVPPHLQGGDFSHADTFKTLNVYKFSRDFCRETFRPLLGFYARSIDHNAYYELVLGMLIYLRKVTVRAEVVTGLAWAEVDDANDLREAEFVIDPAARRTILEHDMGGYWAYDIIDFCFIRNVHFPTPAIVAELRTNLPDLLRHYGSRQQVLDTKMARFLLCSPDRVVALNGASQAFPWLAEIFGGRRVHVPRPTFGEYSRVFPEARVYAEADALSEASSQAEAGDVMVFVNPNNPTGTTMPTDEIHAFAAAHGGVTVMVDESFIAFAEMPSMVTLLERHPLPNVVVLASLGKSLGVPGVRLGFLYTCDADLRAQVLRRMPIWNMGSVAENLLEIVLKHRVEMTASFAQTVRERTRLAQRLAQLSCVAVVHPSGGSFLRVTLTLPQTAAPALIDALLRAHRIFVKDVSTRFDDPRVHLRVAVRSEAENERFCRALAEVADAVP